MLLIDKRNDSQRLIVTVGENTITSDPSYVLHIHSLFSNRSFTVDLPQNTSVHPERYDEFVVDTLEFADMSPGKYAYTITEETDGVMESGMMSIVDEVNDDFEAITPEQTDDDFIIYNPA